MASRFDDIRQALGLTDGRAEALGQGLTMGFGDELGAGLQAGMAALTPGMSAKDTYHGALGENRGIMADERAKEPGMATALETIGSIPTSFAIPGGAAGLGGALKTGGALGLLSGAGHADGADLDESMLLQGIAGMGAGAAGYGVSRLAQPIIRRVAQARMAAQVARANAAAEQARVAAQARPDLQALRSEAQAFGARNPGHGAQLAGRAEGYLQQETDKLAREGTTWVDQATGFKHEGMSGLRSDDLLWPGTDKVRIPAATDEEAQLFQRLRNRANTPSPSASSEASTRNLRTPSLEPTAAPVTKPADRETMLRAFRRAQGIEEM